MIVVCCTFVLSLLLIKEKIKMFLYYRVASDVCMIGASRIFCGYI